MNAIQESMTEVASQIWNEYAASLNVGDIDRWIGLWTDDGVQMPPDAPANFFDIVSVSSLYTRYSSRRHAQAVRLWSLFDETLSE